MRQMKQKILSTAAAAAAVAAAPALAMRSGGDSEW